AAENNVTPIHDEILPTLVARNMGRLVSNCTSNGRVPRVNARDILVGRVLEPEKPVSTFPEHAPIC
ncbi:MAG: hypothetical protein ABI377_03305, partial [Devosia sp.]